MNKNFHRIVFNAARGVRMVVQETARSVGKAAGATPGVLATALAGLLASAPAPAQIVGAPNVPGTLRPTVLVAPNGVPLVNIQTPSAAGVSRNLYHQFDVQSRGVILNNSRTNVQTQLGGWVPGNPHLATGPARIILNEIVSGKLGSAGDLSITTTQGLAAHGTHLAAGAMSLQGASVDLSNSTTSAANVAVTATQGNVSTGGATVTTPGTLRVAANTNAGQSLTNQGGQLNAGQLSLSVSNLANTSSGEIVQTGTGATTIATSGEITNTDSRIASIRSTTSACGVSP